MNASLRSVRPGGSVIVLGNVENRCASLFSGRWQQMADNVSRSVFPLPLGYIILNSIRVCGSDSIERDHLRRLFAFMDSHSLRPRLHSVLPLPVSVAAAAGAFTRICIHPFFLHSPAFAFTRLSYSRMPEAVSAHEIVESRGVQGRVVLDVDSACWE